MDEDFSIENVSQLICDYISYIEIEKGLSKNTILAYESDLVAFFDFLESEKKFNTLDEIKRKDFSSYTKFLAKKKLILAQ